MIQGLIWGLASAWLLLTAATVYWVGPHAWDDGAITLAFARTLAEHGEFALTPLSERVEGSSSLLFCLINAALQHVGHFDFNGQIAGSQWLAMAFALATAALTFAALAPAMPDRLPRALLSTLVLCLPAIHREILNGMEMTLFAGLLMAHLLTINMKGWLPNVLIIGLLATRFEAVMYLTLSLAGLWWTCPAMRPQTSRRLIVTVLTFLMFTLLRHVYFGEWLPNTVLAKAHAPYSGIDLVSVAVKKLGGVAEVMGVMLPVVLALVALLTLQPPRWTPRRQHLAWLLGAYLVMSLAIGKNWGYEGRMFIGMMPLAVVFAAELLHDIFPAEHHRLGLLTLLLAGTFWSNRNLVDENLRTALVGGHLQQRLPVALERVVSRHPSQIYASPVTPAAYRETGEAVEQMRRDLGLKSLVFMTPDVGGLALCCEHLRIVDIGLLTNRQLARHGYKALNDVLNTESPDAIETHAPWSSAAEFYKNPTMRNNYVPIVYQNNLLWVHKRHEPALAALASSRLTRLPIEAVPSVVAQTLDDQIDMQALRSGHGNALMAIDQTERIGLRHVAIRD